LSQLSATAGALPSQVVEQIVDPAGNVVYAFQPEEQGKLPVSEKNLGYIKDAMLSVTSNVRGTAYNTFKFVKQKIWGKTGTAQTSPGALPNAWFAGFTDEEDPEKPNIAIAVLVENIGEGSDFAAPIFRRVLELYYNGQHRCYITGKPACTSPRRLHRRRR
jgi:penicillin-binding protein 2